MKEALKLALEALEFAKEGEPGWTFLLPEAITAIEQALAAPVQEPVAHCEAGPDFCPVCRAETRSKALAAAVGYIQRNTPTLVWTEICRALDKSSPAAQRQWVGLTDEQIKAIDEMALTKNMAIAMTMRTLKEKNNG